MEITITICGCSITPSDIQRIQSFMDEHPHWHRTKLSRELCIAWDWKTHNGQYKDMACRGLLLKLEKLGIITLPLRRAQAYNSLRNRLVHPVQHRQSPIHARLKTLVSLHIERVQKDEHKTLFHTLLALYHYLGSSRMAGENVKYIVFDRNANPLACILFGSPAWKVAPRDSFIGWDILARKHSLHLIANNLRFLILPWVRVPHLASHILGLIARRIRNDFVHKYGHPVYLLETFVERERFDGIIISDRFSAYLKYHKDRTCGLLQLCWAHIIRDVKALCTEPAYGSSKPFSLLMRQRIGTVFRIWHAHKHNTLSREQLIALTQPILLEMRSFLENNRNAPSQAVSKFSCQLLKKWEHLFVFLSHQGVEPTNNLAERSIRPAVQSRKLSYCTRSDKGQILRVRLLTVWQSCRMQRRNTLDFFRQSIHAHRHHLPMPSLLLQHLPDHTHLAA